MRSCQVRPAARQRASTLLLVLFGSLAWQCADDGRPAPRGGDESADASALSEDGGEKGTPDEKPLSDAAAPLDSGTPPADEPDAASVSSEGDAGGPRGELQPGPESQAATDAGVSLGSYQEGLGIASACLHIDVRNALYAVVPDAESPAANYERVLQFVYRESGASIYASFPWTVQFAEDEELLDVLPFGQELVARVARDGAGVRLRFVLEPETVRLLSVVFE